MYLTIVQGNQRASLLIPPCLYYLFHFCYFVCGGMRGLYMCFMFLFRAIMQKSEHAKIIVNSTLQLCAALQL